MKKEIYIYRVIITLILLAWAITSYPSIKKTLLFNRETPDEGILIEKGAPYAKEVRKIIAPLRYSAFYDFIKPEVRVRLNFEDRTWTLRNIHRFDKKGNVLLAEGKYGICGDLVVHTYRKIRPIFDKRYAIQFLRVAESGYFNIGRGSHMILRIIDQTLPYGDSRKIYLLDPSFRRYGGLELFSRYYPLMEYQEGYYPLNPDESFDIKTGPPILINDHLMMSFRVNGTGNQFDRNHYRFAMTLTRRFGFLDHEIFVMEQNGGEVKTYQPQNPYLKMVPQKIIEKSIRAAETLFASVEITEPEKPNNQETASGTVSHGEPVIRYQF